MNSGDQTHTSLESFYAAATKAWARRFK